MWLLKKEGGRMKFSRNPVSGQVEIYSDDGVYLGIVSTMGDSFMNEEQSAEDGGPGSGNFGHKGRPGKRGGSGPGGGKQYRGGRADIGYYNSRKDWLNGLQGEKQYEAVRYIAKKKRELNSKLEAKNKIMTLAQRGFLTYGEAEERLKEGKLDGLKDDMTPEEYIMRNGSVQETHYLLSLAKRARSWDETKDRLINGNLSDEEKAIYNALTEKQDDWDQIYGPSEMWKALLTQEQLEAKAMGLVDFDVDVPDEIQYRLGTKERPEPEGPDYSWYEGKRSNYSAKNLETYLALAIGETASYAHQYTKEEFAELNQKFVDQMKYGNPSPNEVSYYATNAVSALRNCMAKAEQTPYGYTVTGDFEYTPEMMNRLSDDEKKRLLEIVNKFSDYGFSRDVSELDTNKFFDAERKMRKTTPRSKADKREIQDYVLLQEKMLTGCVPMLEEELEKQKEAEAERQRAEQAEKEAERAEMAKTPEAQAEIENAKKLREARMNGEKPRQENSKYAYDLGQDMYAPVSETMDACKNVDIQVAWDIYHGEIPVNKSEKNFFRPSTGEIHLNYEKAKNGEKIHAPFESVFHETAHAIDDAAGDKFGYNGPYHSGHANFSSSWHNGEFCDIIEKEGKAVIEQIGKIEKERFERELAGAKDLDFLERYYERGSQAWLDVRYNNKPIKWSTSVRNKGIASWLKDQEYLHFASLCDTIQGVSRSKIQSFAGHAASYFQGSYARENMASEVFAELYAGMITNPGSVEVMRKYMPKTVECFEKMIKEIAERG